MALFVEKRLNRRRWLPIKQAKVGPRRGKFFVNFLRFLKLASTDRAQFEASLRLQETAGLSALELSMRPAASDGFEPKTDSLLDADQVLHLFQF